MGTDSMDLELDLSDDDMMDDDGGALSMDDDGAAGGGSAAVGAGKGSAGGTFGGMTAGVAFLEQRKLAEYYLAQILLYAELAANRSYHSIEQLERQFSYATLVSCMACHLLPFRLRAAFTTLLQRLYVDRYPQLPLRIPETVHVLHGHDGEVACAEQHLLTARTPGALPSFEIRDKGLLDDPRPHFSIGHSDKFRLLEEVVDAYFHRIAGRQTAARSNQNAFTQAVMELLQVRYSCCYTPGLHITPLVSTYPLCVSSLTYLMPPLPPLSCR
jgi:hypothetical protein